MTYIIKRNNRRYNTKTFNSYEEARKYVRKLVTKIAGRYNDAISSFGFSIAVR